MDMILIFAVLAFMALILLKSIAAKKGSDTDSPSTLGYRQKKTLFTEAERSFLGVLDQVIDTQQYRVFGKVRVADILEPNPTQNRTEWSRAFGKIKAKHFDYVICAVDTLKPVCAIELDDSSHKQSKRQQRDQLLESVCQDAGLTLIRVPAKRAYLLEEVKKVLSKAYCVTGADAPASGDNDALQLLGKDENKGLSESGCSKVEDIQVTKIGGTIK